MFCPKCGSQVSEGLRFCNRCGASLATERSAPPKLLAIIIVLSLAVAVVTTVGLLFIVILGTEMMGRRDSTAETYIYIAVLFLIVLGVDALMVRQISRLLTVYLQAGEQHNPRAESPGILKASAPELPTPAAAETTALNNSVADTREVAADTNEQELPTRKL